MIAASCCTTTPSNSRRCDRSRGSYSVAIAASTSRRPARRAGKIAATSPATTAKSKQDHEARDRHRHGRDEGLGQRGQRGEAKQDADSYADRRAERRHDRPFPPDHASRLATGHADGSEQSDLANAFEHRERQRVRDPEHRDDDGQQQQDVDHDEQLVDLAALALDERRPVLEVELREVAQDRLQRSLELGTRYAGGRFDRDELVERVAEVGVPRAELRSRSYWRSPLRRKCRRP